MTRWGLIALVAAAAVSLAASGTGATGQRPVVQTQGQIEAIALEGAVAAYDVQAVGAGCNRLYVRRLKTGVTTQVSGTRTCRADETSTGRGVVRIALTAERAAWIVNRGGNTESVDMLLSSPVSRARETRVAETLRRGNVDLGLAGGWLGGLVSDGTTIAYNIWRTSLDESGKARIESASLRRVNGSSTAPVAAGTETLAAEAADSARVTVLRGDGSLALYRMTGPHLRTIVPTVPGLAVALSGQRVAVLTAARTIEIRAAGSGALLKTWPAAGRISTRLDLEGRTLVYGVGRRVHALDVVTGKSVILASPQRAIVDVQIEPSGVLYAYNVSGLKPVGRLMFMPASTVAARFGG